MSKKCKSKINLGFVVAALGIGIIATVIIPYWGWLLIVGVGLVGAGWWLIENHCKH